MANVIKIKAGSGVPTTSNIEDRELAFDRSNNKLYINDSGTIVDLTGQAGGGPASTADRIEFTAQAGEALSKGDVVYISGLSGNTPVVSKADADDANKMPAFGLASSSALLNNSVDIVTFGVLENLDTSAFTQGDTLFVSTTPGGLTATKPTGETGLIQNIAYVVRSAASVGAVKIGGAGRTAATPNLNQDKIFLGNASNQSTPTALSSVNLTKFNNDLWSGSANQLLTDDGDGTATSESNLTFDGSAFNVTGSSRVTGNGGLFELVGTDHAYIEYFPDGISAGRKAYVGFASSGNDIFTIANESSDQDLKINVNDGGSTITALQIDASNVGRVVLPNDNQHLAIGADLDLRLYNNGSASYIANQNQIFFLNQTAAAALYLRNTSSDQDIYISVNDGGSQINAIQIDASNVGAVKLPNDNQILYIGEGLDLRLRHDGSNSYIQNITGAFLIDNLSHGSKLQFATEDSLGVKEYVLNITGDNHRVGIGTVSPSQKLHIAEGNVYITKTNGPGTIYLRDSRASYDAEISQRSDGRISLATRAGTYGSSGSIEILDSGNVGIGTTTPGALLDVNGTAYLRTAVFSDTFKPYSGTLATYGSSSSTDHYFVGDVGIGTNSPLEELDIAGSLKVRGDSAAATEVLELGQFVSPNVNTPQYTFNTYDAAGGLPSMGDHLEIRSVRWGQSISFSRNGQGGAVPTALFYNGSSSGYMELYKATNPTTDATYTTQVKLNVNGNSYLNGGNVGIGTTSPSYSLHVIGTGQFSDDVRIGDDLVFNANANYIYQRDSVGTLTRVLGINGSNTTYIGPIDAYAGGRMYYGASANMSGHNFYTGGTLRMKLDGYVLDLPNTGNWSSILNNTNSGGLRFGSKDAGGTLAYQIELSNTGNYVKLNENTTVTGNITVSGTVDGRDVASDGSKLDGIESGATADQTKADIDALNVDADTLDGVQGASFLRSDADDTASGQYNFTKVNDHAIKVGTIRGTVVGSQSGQYMQLYERVHIGSPSGWGSRNAPSYGLSTYGGANLATDTGNVGIGLSHTTTPSAKFHVSGDSYFNGQLRGGFGAVTTSGTTDWNHSTNARSGNGYTLLLNSATNGPTTASNATNSSYYHTLNFEYASYDGDANMTQLGIPYSFTTSLLGVRPVIRSRYLGTWSSWNSLITGNSAGQVLGAIGTAAAPSYSFATDATSDTDTGMLRHAENTIGFSTGGSTRFTMNGSGVFYASSAIQAGNAGVQIWDGTHGFKTVLAKDSTYTKLLNNDGTNCIYLGDSLDANNYYDNGTHIFRNSGGGATYARIGSGYIRGEGGGSVGTPQFSFQNDPNTGMYSLGADDLGFSAGGVLRYGILNGLNRFYANVVVGPNNNNSKPYIQYKDGYDTASTPSYSWYFDNGCGIGHPAGSVIAFSTGSAERARITNTGLKVIDGSAAAPSLSFTSDPDLGFYRNGANNIRFSAGNSIRGTWNGDGLVLNGGSLGVNVAVSTAADGRIDAGNDIVAYSSDKRLKENIRPINNALDKVNKLSGFIYNWNKLANEQAGFDMEEDLVGVYAQDVEEVLPEAVKLAPFDNDGEDNSKSGENYLTVQYEKMVPLLIEAIKEQQQQINELKEKLNG